MVKIYVTLSNQVMHETLVIQDEGTDEELKAAIIEMLYKFFDVEID